MNATPRPRRLLLAPIAALALLLAGPSAQAAFAPPLNLTGGLPDLFINNSVLSYTPTPANPELTINATGFQWNGTLDDDGVAPNINYFVNLATSIQLTSGQLDPGTGSTLTITGYRQGDPATPVLLLSGYLFRFGVGGDPNDSVGVFEGMIKITYDALGFNTRHAGFIFGTTNISTTPWDETVAFTATGTYDIFAVPVPTPLALMGLGLLGLRLLRRRA